MYRKTEDFLQEWQEVSEGTLAVFHAMTDEKMDQAIAENHNTLGWLGWHITTAACYFGPLIGLKLDLELDYTYLPKTAAEIIDAYGSVRKQIKQAVMKMSDEQLLETVDNYGQQTARGSLLRKMIEHEIHHRGQMTVLLRQAGLKVPGVMGPTAEDGGYK